MVLEDHKRVGKRFVPPFLQLGDLQEASWIDLLLPELIWIGILIERCGLGRAAALCAELAKRGQELLEASDGRAWLCRISSYGEFTEEERAALFKGLAAGGMGDELGNALAPLCGAYPECPLSFLVQEPASVEEGAAYVRGVIADLFDRWGESATFVQVHAVYMAFVQGRLFVQRDTAMANFPAVEAYPHTEEARHIASLCRASVNMFFGPEGPHRESFWPRYFWNRGLELEPCRPMGQAYES